MRFLAGSTGPAGPDCTTARRSLLFVALYAVLIAATRAADAPGVTAAPTATPTHAAVPAQVAELAAFKQAIRARYDLKERAFAAHDAETIVARFYSADVISVGEGEGIFVGRDQIRPLYQEVVKSNKVKIESVHTYVNGNAGWDWADFHVFPTDGKTRPFTFAILFLWSRVDGQWICKGDYFMTGSFKDGKLTPPPAPAAHDGGGAEKLTTR